MLYCAPYEGMAVKEVFRREDALWIVLEQGLQKLEPVEEGILRVRYTKRDAFSEDLKPGIVEGNPFADWTYEEAEERILLRLKSLQVEIDRKTNRFTYFDGEGKLLLSERQGRCKELEEFPVFRMVEGNARKEYMDTPDGRKEVVREASKIQTGTAYHTRMHFLFGDEALYGLGQHEEGYASLRGQRVYLNQGNRRIAIPMLVSTKGYGILLNTYAPAIFNDTAEGAYFYTEADPEMDFFFICGRRMGNKRASDRAGHPDDTCAENLICGSALDEVVRGYRRVTGKAVMLPKWAFGYMQSQERYETQEEILQVAGEYRRRGLGLDCIVLDWCSWKDGQWGQKTFDPERFPDPDEMTEKLHQEHVHFMVSIWPNLTEGTPNYEDFAGKGLLLPGIHIYHSLSEEGREIYWKQVQEGLFCHGVDAWWCDNSEPIAPEWNHLVRPENSRTYEEYCQSVALHLPTAMTNAFGFFHAQGIYEGQRKASQKRVVNLTRSGYIGQQRFGTILWSGDISASWETLRKQIAAGVHFCASGMPYWTVDIGAFFVKNGMQWYWDGQYDLGPKDPAYCELFTRWYQWGAFLPVFRGHGTDFRRELWEFDHPAAPFYEALVAANRLRYELMPYLYSLAGHVWKDDGSIIKPLAYGFPEDRVTWDIMNQYLFGDGILVCPVTEPFYFGEGRPSPESLSMKEDARDAFRQEQEGAGEVQRVSVYLPAGQLWYDFWTNEAYEGGQWIQTQAPLDRIPLFVKAGTILPRCPFAQSVEEQTGEIALTVYDGADGCFELYEDAGDGYGYERGEYTITRLEWDVDGQILKVNGEGNLAYQVTLIKACGGL